MRTDGVFTIGALLLILWLAVSKVNGESRLAVLLRALGIGGGSGTGSNAPKGAVGTATDFWGNLLSPDVATKPEGVTRAPNMARPYLFGGVPPFDDSGFDLAGFGVVTAVDPSTDFTKPASYPGPVSNPYSSPSIPDGFFGRSVYPSGSIN